MKKFEETWVMQCCKVSHLNTLHNEVTGLDLVLFWWHLKKFKHDVCSFKYLEGVHFEKRFF